MTMLLNERGSKLLVDAGGCRPRSRDRRAARPVGRARGRTGGGAGRLTGAHLRIEQYKAQLAQLRRMQFGRSSEKLDTQIAQLELMLEDLEESEAAGTASAARRAPDQPPRERRQPVRRPLPDHLPREEVVHDPGRSAGLRRHPVCQTRRGRLRDLGEDPVSVRGRGGKSAVSARRAQCPITWSSARA